MKKIINKTENVVEDMLQGMVKAHPEYLKRISESNVLVRKKSPVKGKVALLSGGGSGHEPAHGGFVGLGMLDGAVAGEVFTSPTAEEVLKGIKAVDGGAGVLLIIKNYSGDVMNFEMAAELAQMEDISIEQVIVNDDVAVEDSTYTIGRRGIAGTIFVHKIAGAAAEKGWNLENVKRVAQKTIKNVRTMGMSLSPCIVPSSGKPSFEIEEDEMEFGLGIHGEPGIRREKIKSADEIADALLDNILKDMDLAKGDEVALLVNGLGGTPLMELYIVNKEANNLLKEKEVKVYKTMVGNYMTSLEMKGVSLSLLKLDEELKKLLDSKADTPAFKQL
ncbi:dihydroxyacetone kinase subunit DhaK [Garciella nitratireducens]|uniref:phosphoenolpyruvate--glycerone phosphotransferase n=1 Tax=Garciella nitratireducens DSM 15102 TaxID=1121911 RepID=A0A1T4KZB1_9FIRM|nr:dihydroxyacetone kinase subunit DhaK [Garciella nitratireducens]SJZ47713.1 dihydroxyacetone kinase DhaK subunit [Garciella nitratireducens DSM 15102]